MAQSIEHLTLDFSSGLDLRVLSSSPALGSMLGQEPTLKKKGSDSASVGCGCSLYFKQAPMF